MKFISRCSAGRAVAAVPAFQDAVVAIPSVLQPDAAARVDPRDACTHRDKRRRRCIESAADEVLHERESGCHEALGPYDNSPEWSRSRPRAIDLGGIPCPTLPPFYASSTYANTATLVTRTQD
jgi:hypothetical protein